MEQKILKLKKHGSFIYFLTSILLLAIHLVAMAETSKTSELSPMESRLQAIEKRIEPAIRDWEFSLDGQSWTKVPAYHSADQEHFFYKTSLKSENNFAGTRVKGTPLYLITLFSARGECHVKVSVNGKPAGTFIISGTPGESEEIEKKIEVTASAGSKRYEVILEVENKGFQPPRSGYWPPRTRPLAEEGLLLQVNTAYIFYPQAESMFQEVNAWLQSMKTGNRLLNPDLRRFTFTGKPYHIEDKRKVAKERLDQLNTELSQAIHLFDLDALEKGDSQKVKHSIEASYQAAKNVIVYAREFKVYLIGNAHIDIAWLWRMAETVMVARNTYETVIKNMGEYPELHYAQSQALTYYWIEKKYPWLFQEIKKAWQQGHWEIVGGMWVEPDCNLISGESWVRQILYGKNYFKEKFGCDVKIGWNVDSFGYNWNMPQFYRKSGIDLFVTQKIWWNDTTVFPYYIFWWEGVDGTRLLSYFPPEGYTSRVQLDSVANNITKYEATTGYKKSLILYGIGDHGGGPNRETLNRVRDYGQLSIAPDFIHSRSAGFLEKMQSDLGEDIPVWKDELYLEYHRGTYTTQAAVKKGNRRSEEGLSTAEKAASLTAMVGKDANEYVYPKEKLENTWKQVLTNQFHDILPGSSITPVYRDALEVYQQVEKSQKGVTKKSLLHLAKVVDTGFVQNSFKRKTTVPVLVFNPLSWVRSDMVEVFIPGETGTNWIIVDQAGRVEPAEIEEDQEGEEGGVRIVFLAHDVPAIGYKVYAAVKGDGVQALYSNLEGEGGVIENDFFRVVVNEKSGNIKSIYWKLKRRELVPVGCEANILQVYEDRPQDWDAWNIGYTGRMWEINQADSVKIVKQTQVRIVLEVKKSFLGMDKERYSPTEDFPSSFFTQYITLYKDLPRIDILTEADWWESHMFLKAAFPLDISSEYATYEIPYAAIRRTTRSGTLWEKARFEVPALRWADLSDDRIGVSLLNDCKYGYDIHGNVMKLSLLRAPTWPDKMADRGKHTFTYSLYVHDGNWNDGDTVKQARQLNSPLIAVVTGIHKGSLPALYSFFTVSPGGVILDTVKQAEAGRGFILRLYESLGREEQVMVTCFVSPKRVIETNLIEQQLESSTVMMDGKTVQLSFKPFEIKTLKVDFD